MNNNFVFDNLIPFRQEYIAMFLISRKMCSTVKNWDVCNDWNIYLTRVIVLQ